MTANDAQVMAMREGAAAMRDNASRCRAIVDAVTMEPPPELQERAAKLTVLAGLLDAMADEREAA